MRDTSLRIFEKVKITKSEQRKKKKEFVLPKFSWSALSLEQDSDGKKLIEFVR